VLKAVVFALASMGSVTLVCGLVFIIFALMGTTLWR
jgi:hypothetical protein